MAYTSKLQDGINLLPLMNVQGIDYIPVKEVTNLIKETELDIDTEVSKQILLSNANITLDNNTTPINCGEHEQFIRSHAEPQHIVIACVIPLFIHLFLCVITQLTNLNFEGITGGIIRAATGSFAVIGLLALGIFILAKYVIRILYVRYTVSSCENYPVFDGITDYKQLTSWQRLKLDTLIIFGLSLLFSIVFIGQLLGFLQIPTTNLNP